MNYTGLSQRAMFFFMGFMLVLAALTALVVVPGIGTFAVGALTLLTGFVFIGFSTGKIGWRSYLEERQ